LLAIAKRCVENQYSFAFHNRSPLKEVSPNSNIATKTLSGSRESFYATGFSAVPRHSNRSLTTNDQGRRADTLPPSNHDLRDLHERFGYGEYVLPVPDDLSLGLKPASWCKSFSPAIACWRRYTSFVSIASSLSLASNFSATSCTAGSWSMLAWTSPISKHSMPPRKTDCQPR
jgi:hypothetical protein